MNKIPILTRHKNALISLESLHNVKETLETYIKDINSSNYETSQLIIEKIKKILLVAYDDNVVVLWSQIIQYYRKKEMLDVFIDYYFVLEQKIAFEIEFEKMYKIFTVYYFKFLNEFEKIPILSTICGELRLMYNEIMLEYAETADL